MNPSPRRLKLKFKLPGRQSCDDAVASGYDGVRTSIRSNGQSHVTSNPPVSILRNGEESLSPVSPSHPERQPSMPSPSPPCHTRDRESDRQMIIEAHASHHTPLNPFSACGPTGGARRYAVYLPEPSQANPALPPSSRTALLLPSQPSLSDIGGSTDRDQVSGKTPSSKQKSQGKKTCHLPCIQRR
ncbi:hypothetical protein EW146_g2346 [Bondarzewia mesenterica]|uniref:Uncharacterized protein n=1 Tax=Bondarzewia mesenterica TaxID=1095465 RepID=A0A4S4M113_9AGAM|nr:hypothetical protein EW146_g2346 [Bondarzewia mesenterica]